MKKFDRYIATYFISSFSLAFLFLVGLFLMVDALGKIDEFIAAARELPPEMQSSVPANVFRFYVLSVPYYYLQFAPFIALLAILFTGIRLSQGNELVPIVTAGVSLFRVMVPLFVGALLVAGSMFAVREKVIPQIDDLRDSIRDRLLYQRPERVYTNVWMMQGAGNSVRCGIFYPGRAAISDLIVKTKSGETQTFTTATEAKYQNGPEGLGWYLVQGKRSVRTGHEPSKIQDAQILRDLEFTPYDLFVAYKGQDNPTELSFGQLNLLSLKNPERLDLMTLLHFFLTFPLMALILPLIGLPFVLRFESRSASEGVIIAVLVFFAYFGIDLWMRSLGNSGGLHPLIASWFPVVLFGSLGIILFDATQT